MGKKQSQSPWSVSQEEYNDRISFAFVAIATLERMSDIKDAFRAHYGDLSFRSIYRYVERAKSLISGALAPDRSQLIADQVARHLSIFYDLKNTGIARNRALESVNRLLGLEMPRKVAYTDPQGQHAWTPLPPDKLAESVVNRLVDFSSRARLLGNEEEGVIDSRVIGPPEELVEATKPGPVEEPVGEYAEDADEPGDDPEGDPELDDLLQQLEE